MIVKKVPARPAGRNATVERATHARRLVDYLRLPEKESAEKAYMVAYMLEEKLGQTAGERLFHQGARGFVSTTLAGQRAEMIAIAQMAKRSPNPVDHWILSWPEGELPEPGQIDEVVAMFVEHLGVANQPCIYAVHGDTHNRHLHIALNRYDATAKRMVEINDGFNLEAAHQAVAIIVDHFGWRPEAEARYEMVDGLVGLTRSAQERMDEGRKPIRQEAAAYENRTGYRSAQRIAQEEAMPIIAAAGSWRELHAHLADAGMTYTPKGTNGMVFEVDHQKVKASDVSPTITRTRLEKRLGPFEAPEPTLSLTPRTPDFDRFPDAFRADEYRADREHWRRRKQVASSSHPEPDKADVVERARAAARARDRGLPSTGRKLRWPPPDLESWYYFKKESLFADRWRSRKRVEPFPTLLGDARPNPVQPPQIDGYHAYTCSDGVRYARGPRESTAFVDRGSQVDVVMDSDEALLSGLRLAVLKMDGRVIVRAEPPIRDRILALAEANGLRHFVHDPEQQEARRTSVDPAIETLRSSNESEARKDRANGEPARVVAPHQPARSPVPSPPSSATADETASTVPPIKPALEVEAAAGLPAVDVARLSSSSTDGGGNARRKPNGVTKRLFKDYLRAQAKREQGQEPARDQPIVDADATARSPTLVPPAPGLTVAGDPSDRHQTPADASQPRVRLKKSLGKGPADLDPSLKKSLGKGPPDLDPPIGWPPSRGSSRG